MDEKNKLTNNFRYKKNGGITLIALVITIVVMLILVAITINVALNGGLFSYAGKAVGDTNKKKAEEQEYANLQSGMTTDQLIAKYTTRQSELTDLEKYIYGANGQGRILSAIAGYGNFDGIVDPDTLNFLPDPDDSNSKIYQDLKWGGAELAYYGGNIGGYFPNRIYIRYGRDVYSFDVDLDLNFDTYEFYIKSVKDTIRGPIKPTGNLGKYATYNNIRYIVMAEDSNTITLISANSLGNVLLGPSNSSYSMVISEEAIAGYNNAINILLEACKEATGITTVDGTNVISIRSVGNKNIKYTSGNVITGSDTTQPITYNWQEAGASSDWYTAHGFNSLGIKKGDTNYTEDVQTMKSLGILCADNMGDLRFGLETPGSYWMASRYVRNESAFVRCFVNYVDSCGAYESENLDSPNYVLALRIDGGISSYYGGCTAVRPIVTLSKSAPGLVIED